VALHAELLLSVVPLHEIAQMVQFYRANFAQEAAGAVMIVTRALVEARAQVTGVGAGLALRAAEEP
jgi:hypothetical protein